MNSDPDTFILDNNPAALLPFSKRLLPEDPEATPLPKAYTPSNPALYGEDYK